ncbi:SMI1/KNR4 family protein [Sphingomonas sp. 1P06PA]|uniref:SMI1/KNR4 family protein n=1 Tax=Sphingomonas sp. 1P06PA TaxID=554121 RepID=UPI0039A6759B
MIELTGGSAADPAAIAAVERQLAVNFPESYRTFVETRDGARPEPNRVRAENGTELGVDQFIPVAEIIKERNRIETIPLAAFPVAWMEGGNYVFIDGRRGGRVRFWDHESPDDMIDVAPDFESFLNAIEPFDPDTVELKPGQVEKAWIDPDFLKQFGG